LPEWERKGTALRERGTSRTRLRGGGGSESGAHVRQVIRERSDRRSAKTHGLWKQRAAYGNGGVQNDRAFT
jgi:hypothetical protein